MSELRLIAADVDGTLVGADYQVSPRVRKAVSQARARGVSVSLVTGRPWCATLPYVSDLGLAAPQVSFNGALVSLPGSGTPLYAHPLPHEMIAHLVAYGRQHAMFLELHTMQRCFVERMGAEGLHQREKLGHNQVLTSFDDLALDGDIYKAQYVIGTERHRSLLDDLVPSLDGLGELSWGISPAFHGWFVNVMPPGISKATGLQVALDYLGLTWDEVLAAGDSPSDLLFVEPAGYGVIMGNAPEATRTQAPRLAPHVAEDGLAQVIEAQILSGNGAGR